MTTRILVLTLRENLILHSGKYGECQYFEGS